MRKSILAFTGALLATLFTSSQIVYAGNEIQNILINEELQIPGTVLSPGKFALSVEDRLYDRVIVKVARVGKSESYLILAVPRDESAAGLDFFRQAGSGPVAMKRWLGFEFVYPKQEAVRITGDSGQAVLAVDPASDKLPVKMSREDMKVATLWSLSPEHLTSSNRGMGVTAVKYASASDSSATVGAPAASPVRPPVPSLEASARSLPARLPKTASNNYTYLLCGGMLLGFGAGVRTLRMRRAAAL